MNEEIKKSKVDLSIKKKNIVMLDKFKEEGMGRSTVVDMILDGFFSKEASALNLKPKQGLEDSKRVSMNEKRDQLITPDFVPFPKGKVSGIVAPGSTGKTFFALYLAMTHVMTEYYERSRKVRVLAWLSEDSFEDTGDRFQTVSKVMDLQPKDKTLVSTCIDILDSESEVFHFVNFMSKNEVSISPKFKMFVEACEPYDLIIIDPLIAFFGGNENDNAQAKAFMQLLTHWANTTGKTIVLIHHSAKDALNARGASAFFDAFRFLIGLEKFMVPKTITRNDGKVEIAKDMRTGKTIYEEIESMKSMRRVVILKDNNNILRFIKVNHGVENPAEFNIQLLPTYDGSEDVDYIRPSYRFIQSHEPEFDVFQTGGVNISNFDSLEDYFATIQSEVDESKKAKELTDEDEDIFQKLMEYSESNDIVGDLDEK